MTTTDKPESAPAKDVAPEKDVVPAPEKTPVAPPVAVSAEAPVEEEKKDDRVSVKFLGHTSPHDNTEILRNEDGDYRVGDQLKLSHERIQVLTKLGYRLEVPQTD